MSIQLPAALLAQLRPEGRAILTRGAQNMGAIPFRLQAGPGGALQGYNLTLDSGGASGFTLTTVVPSGVGADQRVRLRKVSGAGASATAGWFGLPTVGMILSPTAGWVMAWISALTIGTVGRGGSLVGATFAGDFEPDGVGNGRGWTKGSGDSADLRWYNGVPGVTVPLTGGTLPTDGRRCLKVMGVAAGSGQLYACLIDLANMTVADERVTTAPAVVVALEDNASPGPLGAGQPSCTEEFEFIEGSLEVRSLL